MIGMNLESAGCIFVNVIGPAGYRTTGSRREGRDGDL